MPVFTRWSIRFSLLCLLLSWGLELWRMAQPAWVPPLLWAHRIAIYHLFFVGWLTQLIFGVAYWMFPTQSRELPRGKEWLGYGVLICLNLGIWLRIAAEPVVAVLGTTGWSPWWRGVLVLAGVLQCLAACGFAVLIWPRIRGSKTRKADHAYA